MQEMRDTIRTSVDAAQQATNASVDAKLDTVIKALAHLPQLAALAGTTNAENGAGAPAGAAHAENGAGAPAPIP